MVRHQKPRTPTLHSFYTITESTSFDFRRQTHPHSPHIVTPLPELNSDSLLGTFWTDFKDIMWNVFSGCCAGQKEIFIPETPAEFRGTAKDPYYWSPKDRGTIAEVRSWLERVPATFGTWSLPRTSSLGSFTFTR